MLRDSVNEYAVTQNRNATITILIIHRTRGESIKIFHCMHGAMEFDGEIQLGSQLLICIFSFNIPKINGLHYKTVCVLTAPLDIQCLRINSQ